MDRTRAAYMKLMKTKRPFALEHWWKAVKDQNKWKRVFGREEMNKRNKLNASGAYSPPNEDHDDDPVEIPQPQGQNSAKAQRKGKDKSTSQSSE